MNYARQLSYNVRALIEKNKLSIKKLANIIDVPASTLTDALKSKKGLPIDLAILIADYFGYTVSDLSKVDINSISHTNTNFEGNSPFVGRVDDALSDEEMVYLNHKKSLIDCIKQAKLTTTQLKELEEIIKVFEDIGTKDV